MASTFELPGSYKKWTLGLIIAGALAIVWGLIMYHPFSPVTHGAGHDAHASVNATRFWAVLLQNSVFWLLVVNASMFFLCITTMAMGGWQVALRRVPEAISSVVPILGVIAFVVLLAIIMGHRTDIYHWLDKDAVAADKILNGKKSFLNPAFFLIVSGVSIFLWWFL